MLQSQSKCTKGKRCTPKLTKGERGQKPYSRMLHARIFIIRIDEFVFEGLEEKKCNVLQARNTLIEK